MRSRQIFGQAVSGFGEQLGLGVSLLIPGGVSGGSAQAEGAAEVDDAGAGGEEGGGQFHGNVGGGGQEDDGDAFGADGFGAAREAGRGRCGGVGVGAGGFAVVEEDRLYMRMPSQDAGKFGSAIAAITDDGDEGGHLGCLFSTMYKYTMLGRWDAVTRGRGTRGLRRGIWGLGAERAIWRRGDAAISGLG